MNILVIGGSGLVGGNFITCFNADISWNVIGTYRNYKQDSLIYFDPLKDWSPSQFQYFHPDVIIHTAGWTYVDGCENDKNKSFIENVEVTKLIIELTLRYSAKLVYLSTDYVFDGANGPYCETDMANPINIYGSHKLLSEKLIESSLENYLILRVTNVYGNEFRRKNFVARIIDELMIEKKREFTFPYDQFATPINAYDIALATKKLIENNKKGIYHLASTDFVSRVQLVNIILRRFNIKNVNINTIKTGTIPFLAPRPLNGGLLASKFIKEFPEFYFHNIDSYLNDIVPNFDHIEKT